MADRLANARSLLLALLDPLRVELPQSPAGLGGLRKPLNEVGKPGAALEKLQRLFHLIRARRASVEVVVDGPDRRDEGLLKLALLLAGEPHGVQGARIRAPHRLLRPEERCQADAEGLRAFKL